MADRLKNKVALITGAGMAWARGGGSLRRRGRGASWWPTSMARRRGDRCAGREEGRPGAGGDRDVALEADVQRLIGEGVRRFGALHVLYNNAGVLWKDRDRSVLETDEKSWDRVMAINLKSVFW